MYQVTKRDGAVADFNITKISAAITKAFDALKKPYHPSVMDMLALRVTAEFESKIKNDLIAVEDIQYIIAKLKYKNIGVIITDHNVGETLAIIDRAYLLYEGSILQSGTPEALAEDDEVRTKYLGSNFVLKRSAAFLRAEAGGPQRINTIEEHKAEAATEPEAVVETETEEEKNELE